MNVFLLALVTENLLLLPFCVRAAHTIQKKKARPNTFAIQNAEAKTALRIQNADISDHAMLILYPYHKWECMTWEFIAREDGSRILKNVYTEKGIEPINAPDPAGGLYQVPLRSHPLQAWDIEPAGTFFRLRLHNTGFYLTAENSGKNSAAILRPKENTERQLWNLIPQRPIM